MHPKKKTKKLKNFRNFSGVPRLLICIVSLKAKLIAVCDPNLVILATMVHHCKIKEKTTLMLFSTMVLY
jgi:hypothetical protein